MTVSTDLATLAHFLAHQVPTDAERQAAARKLVALADGVRKMERTLDEITADAAEQQLIDMQNSLDLAPAAAGRTH